MSNERDPSLRAGLEHLRDLESGNRWWAAKQPDGTMFVKVRDIHAAVADLLRAQPPDLNMELSGGRCPMHPLNGIPCATCGEAGASVGLFRRHAEDLPPRAPVYAAADVERALVGRAQPPPAPDWQPLDTGPVGPELLVWVPSKQLVASCRLTARGLEFLGGGRCFYEDARFYLPMPTPPAALPAVEGTRKQQEGESRVDLPAHVPTIGSTAQTTTGRRS